MNGDLTTDPRLATKLVKIFARSAGSGLIPNLKATVGCYEVDDLVMPVTTSDGVTCPICSLPAFYVDLAIIDATQCADSNPRQSAVISLIKARKAVMRAAGLNRQVQVNNWLFSTNLHQVMTQANAERIRDDLIADHPDRAIVLRSLNDVTDAETITALRAAGFALLPAQHVDVVQNAQPIPVPDTSLQQVSAHTFSAADFSRAAMLLTMPKAGKRAEFCPKYTASYLAQAHQIGLLGIVGLRGTDGQLDGVIGLFENTATVAAPLFGYDTGKPGQQDLIATLHAIGQNRASAGTKHYHMGEASEYADTLQDTTRVMEYTAIYTGHLGARMRLSTAALQKMLTPRSGKIAV